MHYRNSAGIGSIYAFSFTPLVISRCTWSEQEFCASDFSTSEKREGCQGTRKSKWKWRNMWSSSVQLDSALHKSWSCKVVSIFVTGTYDIFADFRDHFSIFATGERWVVGGDVRLSGTRRSWMSLRSGSNASNFSRMMRNTDVCKYWWNSDLAHD